MICLQFHAPVTIKAHPGGGPTKSRLLNVLKLMGKINRACEKYTVGLQARWILGLV